MADIAQIVGTWKLKSIEDPHPDVEVQDFNPTGYTTYDSTGHMSNQIARRSDRPKFASDDPAKGTAEEIRAAFLGYRAYFGTYEVHEKEGIVIHHVEGAIFPNHVGRDNLRYCEISGDRLNLIATRVVDGKILPKASSARRLIWERAK